MNALQVKQLIDKAESILAAMEDHLDNRDDCDDPTCCVNRILTETLGRTEEVDKI